MNLKEAIARWPTPCTTDAKAAGRHTTTTGVMNTGTSLTDAMRGHQPQETRPGGPNGLVLCPEFVEALMGLPVGWTLVDDDDASNILATP